MRKAVWLVVWLVAGVAQADGSLTLTGIEQQRFDEFGCLGSDFGYNHYRLYQVEGLDWQGSLAEAILTEANVYKRDNGGTPEYATFRGYLAQLDTPKETQFVIEQLISQIGLPTFPQTENGATVYMGKVDGFDQPAFLFSGRGYDDQGNWSNGTWQPGSSLGTTPEPTQTFALVEYGPEVAAVPEPSSIVYLGGMAVVGGFAMAWQKYRRRK